MNLEDTVQMAEKVPGWMSREELRWLAKTARELEGPAAWLEIGCFAGRSTLAVGLSLPLDSILVVIDQFDNSYPALGSGLDPEDSCIVRFFETMRFLADQRPDVKVIVLPGKSERYRLGVAPSVFDVAFIDGDHSRAAVASDCETCQGLLIPEGRLCGHDYHADWPDVKSVVDERYGLAVKVIEGTSIWTVTAPWG